MPRYVVSVVLLIGCGVMLNALTQVADSFVGRYFRLEGSGHPKEREGSRFLVCRLASSSLFFTYHHHHVRPRSALASQHG